MFGQAKPIEGKTIWLTGASSGIGKALAIKLAGAGNSVIVSARNETALNQLVSQNPQRIHALPMDVSDADQRTSISQKLQEITDVVDVLIMAAGVAEYEDDLSFDHEKYQRVFGANFFGLINTVAIAKPFLEKSQQSAYIVGIGSLSMKIGFPRAQAYGSSKAAADYFLHTLLVDLPRSQFDVSIVRPGFVETPMTSVNDFPMPFIITAEEAADRIISGMTKRKRLIVFPKRLNILLSVLSWIPCVWYDYLGPKSSRNQS